MLNGTTIGVWERLGVGGGEMDEGWREEANTFPLPTSTLTMVFTESSHFLISERSAAVILAFRLSY